MNANDVSMLAIAIFINNIHVRTHTGSRANTQIKQMTDNK